MTNSISCPVCQNLCSSQASSCPKCGHPLNTNESLKNEPLSKSSQPFIIIFKIIAYLSLAFGALHGLFLVIALVSSFFVNNIEWWKREGFSTGLYFVVGMLSYAFFSFLISQAKKK